MMCHKKSSIKEDTRRNVDSIHGTNVSYPLNKQSYKEQNFFNNKDDQLTVKMTKRLLQHDQKPLLNKLNPLITHLKTDYSVEKNSDDTIQIYNLKDLKEQKTIKQKSRLINKTYEDMIMSNNGLPNGYSS